MEISFRGEKLFEKSFSPHPFSKTFILGRDDEVGCRPEEKSLKKFEKVLKKVLTNRGRGDII